jgi:hypothetical protein
MVLLLSFVVVCLFLMFFCLRQLQGEWWYLTAAKRLLPRSFAAISQPLKTWPALQWLEMDVFTAFCCFYCLK